MLLECSSDCFCAAVSWVDCLFSVNIFDLNWWHVFAFLSYAPYSNFWSGSYSTVKLKLRGKTSLKMTVRWTQEADIRIIHLSTYPAKLLKKNKKNNGSHQLSPGMVCLSYCWHKVNKYVRLRTARRNWGSTVLMFPLLKCKIDNGGSMLRLWHQSIK